MHIMGTLFSAQNALRSLAPEYKWAGMGNLLGDYGEFVAIRHHGWTKAPPGSDGFDAITPEGQTVQIKANHSSSSIGYRGSADLMLVIRGKDDGEWEEIYFGEFQAVREVSSYSQRDNKHTCTISKLRRLKCERK